MQMSLFYQPQHLFCITVDLKSPDEFKNVIEALPTCFPNMKVFVSGHFTLMPRTLIFTDWRRIQLGIVRNPQKCLHVFQLAH